jgi:hypothetical protein
VREPAPLVIMEQYTPKEAWTRASARMLVKNSRIAEQTE